MNIIILILLTRARRWRDIVVSSCVCVYYFVISANTQSTWSFKLFYTCFKEPDVQISDIQAIIDKSMKMQNKDLVLNPLICAWVWLRVLTRWWLW